MSGLIDLHVHTSCSDGFHSPAEIVQMAARAGLRAIAVTDHDTLSGIPEALKTAEELKKAGLHIEVVPGVELSAEGPNGLAIHVVGLYVKLNCSILNMNLQKFQEQRFIRVPRFIENLDMLGVHVTSDEVMELADGAAPSRVHIAQALINRGYVKHRTEAFDRYLSRNGKAYVPRIRPDCREAANMIRAAGGLPVIAHPALYLRDGMTIQELRLTVESMIYPQKPVSSNHSPSSASSKQHSAESCPEKLGIEVLYPGCTIQETATVASIASEYNLIASGGSDYHCPGPDDSVSLGNSPGTLAIGYGILENIKRFLGVST